MAGIGYSEPASTLQRGIPVPAGLVIHGSPIEGRGVFATRHFKVGEPVHWMDGERVSLIGCGWRIATRRLRFDDPLQIGPVSFIALDTFSVSINSSCDPTTGLRGRNELFAIREIEPGAEITFDYSMTVLPSVFNRHWRMPCRCGAATCRGAIGNLDSVPPGRLADYAALGAIQDYMRPALMARLAGRTDVRAA